MLWRVPDAPPITPTSIACAGCGYDLSGTAIGAACPECGMAVAASLQPRVIGERSCSSATTCFVLGLLSLVICAILGPIAIVVYFQARRELRMGGFGKSSHTFARVGLILGIISTSILAVYALIVGLAGLGALFR